jgi:hypothetical protein
MIPDKNQKEWAMLIEGSLNPKLSSFSFQMTVNSLRSGYRIHAVTMEAAVEELVSTIKKYEKQYQKDLKAIFPNYSFES